MIHRAVALAAVVLATACGSPPPSRTTPVTLDSPPKKVDVASETEESLYDRALAALDEGDLATADDALRELVRRKSTSLIVRSLMSAVRTITGREEVKAHPFANLDPIRVSATPPSSPPGPAQKILVEKVAPRGDGQRLNELVRSVQLQAPSGHNPDPPIQVPHFFVPAKYGGNTLLGYRWSGEHWLALYGRSQNDARFIGVISPTGKGESVFDFAAWRTRNQVAEAGVSWADVVGTTLYVKTEIVAAYGFMAAIEMTTGETLWRSLNLGMTSNPLVTADRVFLYSRQPSQVIAVLHRPTGALLASIPIKTSPWLVDRGDYIELLTERTSKVDAPVLGIRTKTREIAPPPPPPEDITSKRLPASKLAAADVALRREGQNLLLRGDPRGALLKLRAVLERNPGNRATEALYDISREELFRARSRAAFTVLSTPAVRAAAIPKASQKALIAPVKRGKAPTLHLIDERETRRIPTAWFVENEVEPNTFELDESPSDMPVEPIPAWLPSQLGDQRLISTARAREHVVAVWSPDGSSEEPTANVAVFRDEKPVARLVFDRKPHGYGPVDYADVVGDTLFALMRNEATNQCLVAFDLATGSAYWSTELGYRGLNFVEDEGHLIVHVGHLGKPGHATVLEADTGRIVSRTKTPASYPSEYWLARKGTTLFGFATVETARIGIE